MIYAILWSIVFFFCALGYLFLWVQHRNRIPVTVSKRQINGYQHNFADGSQSHFSNEYVPIQSFPVNEPEPAFNIEEKEESPKEEVIDLDDSSSEKEDDNENNYTNDHPSFIIEEPFKEDEEIIDLDDSLDEDENEIYVPQNENDGKSVNSSEVIQTNSNMASSIDDLLEKNKFHKNHQYTTSTNIKCSEKNPDFLIGLEEASIKLVDTDDSDYYGVVPKNADNTKQINPMPILPRCCINIPNQNNNKDWMRKRLDTKAAFRDEILHISNKNQESLIKRKYVVADMIESEKEHCAALKLMTEMLQSLVDAENTDLGSDIHESIKTITAHLQQLLVFHNDTFQINLGGSILNPSGIGSLFLENKKQFKTYTPFIKLYVELKSKLNKSEVKSIKTTNKSSRTDSKMSTMAFLELLKSIERKPAQYCAYLSDVMRYTGRVNDGAIYEFQKAITMFERIQRQWCDEAILAPIFNDNADVVKDMSRIVKVTDMIMVSELKFISRTPEKSPRLNERVRCLMITKGGLVVIDKPKDNSNLKVEMIMKFQHLSLFRKQNITEDNEIMIWNKEISDKWCIYLLYFPSKYSRLGWEYELKRRILKSGVDQADIYIKDPDQIDEQYKQYLSFEKLQVAQENQTITFETADIDENNRTEKDKMEESGNSSSDQLFESARMDPASSVTDTSYKTAQGSKTPEKKSGVRPISAISQDSVSTLDGVRTPFSDEELTNSLHKSVAISTNKSEFSVIENDALSIEYLLENYDPTLHELTWKLAGKQQYTAKNGCDIKFEEKDTSTNTQICLFSKKPIIKTDKGEFTCKIIDKINGSLLATCNVKIDIIQKPKCSVELIPIVSDVTVKDSENIELCFNVNVKSGTISEKLHKSLCFFKDDSAVTIDNDRTLLALDKDKTKLTLSIMKATPKDAGMYTIKPTEATLTLTNETKISILVLVEKRKKPPILKTASQEGNELFVPEDDKVRSISPMKEPETSIQTTDDSDGFKNVVSITTDLSEENLMSKLECEIEEIDLKAGEDLKLTINTNNISPNLININGKWFINNAELNMDKYKAKSDLKDSKLTIFIPDINKDIEGDLYFKVPGTKGSDEIISPKVKVIVRGTKQKSQSISQIITACSSDVKATESEKVVLKVKKIKDFKEPVTWNFQNAEIKKSKEVTINDCELIIEKCQKSNEGNYEIKVSGYEGSVTINLKVNPASTKQKASRIVCKTEELDLIEGQQLEIDLVCENVPQILMKNAKWTLNGKLFKPLLKKGAKCTTSKTGEIKLIIPNVDKNMVGKLKYIVDEKQKLMTDDIAIKVRKGEEGNKDKKEELKLTCDQSDVAINEGDKLDLKVTFNIALDSNLIWKFNDSALKENNNVKSKQKPSSKESILTIEKCDVKHSGKYVCSLNDKEKGVTINVKVNKSIKTSLIDCNIEEIDIKAGEDLNLVFNISDISNDQLVKGVWILNNKEIQPEKYNGKSTFTPESISLSIPNVDKDLNGLIKFVVDSKLKLESPEITIKIRGEKPKPKDDAKNAKLDKKEGAKPKPKEEEKEPQKTKELLKLIPEKEKVTGKINQDISIIVNYNIQPKSSIQWSYKGKTLKPTDNIKITQSKDKKQAILKLLNCQKTQEGVYKCFVNKEDDGVEIQLKLSQPQKTGFLDCDIEEIDLKEGEPLELYFNATDIDVKTLKKGDWYLNGQVLDIASVKGEVNIDKFGIELYIDKIPRTMVGLLIYQIDETLVSPEIEIKIRKPKLDDIKDKELVIQACLKEIKVNNGELLILRYDIIEGNPQQYKKPLIYRDNQEVSEKSIKVDIDTEKVELKIEQCSETDGGNYHCVFKSKEKGLENYTTEMIKVIIIDQPISQKCQIQFEKQLYKIHEGEDVLMRAKVKCKSTHYSVSWLFNGKNLKLSSDIRTDILENGNLTQLEFKNCDVERSGNYICRIESKDGHASEAETKLEIMTPENNKDSSSNALFRQCSIEIMENEQLNIQLNNLLSSKEGLEIVWEKNNSKLTNKDDFDLGNNEDKISLKKSNATIDDSGLYVCKIKNSNDEVQKYEYTVYVHSKLDENQENNDGKLKIKCDNLNIQATENKPLIISVEIQNFEGAKLELIKSSRTIKGPLVLEDRFEDICITKATKQSHGGKIVCKVYKDTGESDEITFNISFDKEDNLGYKGVLLTCNVEEVDLLEGEELNISISTENNHSTENLPRPVWLKDSQELSNNLLERVKLITRPTGYNLILPCVKMSDKGLYSIEIDENNYADITVHVRPGTKLNGQSPKLKQTGKIDNTDPKSISKSSPKAIKHLQNVVLNRENDSCTFEFLIGNCGKTKSVWYFNGKVIEENDKNYQQYSKNDISFVLKVHSATLELCGKYEVTVSNEVGQLKEVAHLSIKKQPKIDTVPNDDSQHIEESCCIAPRFTKKLKSVELSSGDTLRISCRVMSEPEPKILWTRNGETLDAESTNDNRLRIKHEFPNYYLIISGVDIHDAGRYNCLATNLVGFDSTEAIITVDGREDVNDDDESELIDDDNRMSRLTTQIIGDLKLELTNETAEFIELSWTPLSTNDDSFLTYQIERQRKTMKSTWRSIVRNIPHSTNSYTIKLPCTQLPEEQAPYLLRCSANSDLGYQCVLSNEVSVCKIEGNSMASQRQSSSLLTVAKPELVFKDVCCARLVWKPVPSSAGVVSYFIEMKDNPKQSDWTELAHELHLPEYPITLQPGVSYQLRVQARSANGRNGHGHPSQPIIHRVDKMLLAPDLTLCESPWLHCAAPGSSSNVGSPCLKWRPATIPEHCDKCGQGIDPIYSVESRTSRISPWQCIKEDITEPLIYLNKQQLENTFEFRVSCHNKYGQSGPTRACKNTIFPNGDSSSAGGFVRSRSSSVVQLDARKQMNIVNHEEKKKVRIERLQTDEISLEWEKWLLDQSEKRDESSNEMAESAEKTCKYMLQRKYLTNEDWEQVNQMLFGENCTIDFRLNDNYGRTLRLLVLVDEVWHDGYELLEIPNKSELIPSVPMLDKVFVNSPTHHTITWSPSKCSVYGAESLKYIVQSKSPSQLWSFLSTDLTECRYENTRVNNTAPSVSYRVYASNLFGNGDYSQEYTVHTPGNLLVNETIVKGIRYGVVNKNEVEIRWQLTDVVFDSRVPTEDISFEIETKSQQSQTSPWQPVTSNRATNGATSLRIPLVYSDDSYYRIQPYFSKDQPLGPSKLFRVYISKDSLVPDLSTHRTTVQSESIHELHLHWPEPDLSSAFPPDVPILSSSKKYSTNQSQETLILMSGIRYRVEIATVVGASVKQSSVALSRSLEWETVIDEIEETNVLLNIDDPTKDYVVRVFASNVFGEGLPTRNMRIPSQISLPDFSFVRPVIDEKSRMSTPPLTSPGTSTSIKETILSWNPPRNIGTSDNYLPYSVDIQYRVLEKGNYSQDEEPWKVFKEGYKRNRIEVSDLHPDQMIQFRLIPVTEYGEGFPSGSVRRYKIENKDSKSLAESSDNSKSISAESNIYGRLDDEIVLEFTKITYRQDENCVVECSLDTKPLDVNNDSLILGSSSTGYANLRIKNVSSEQFGKYTATMKRDGEEISKQSINLIKAGRKLLALE